MNDIAQKLLQPAINVGLSELDFWNMTKAEIERYIEGAIWRMRSQAQFDYCLADLIGISVARVMSNEVEYPPIEKVYPSLFDDVIKAEKQRQEEEIRMIDSTNRFMEFALKHNAKIREGVETKNI